MKERITAVVAKGWTTVHGRVWPWLPRKGPKVVPCITKEMEKPIFVDGVST